jgi:hypothetical protein
MAYIIAGLIITDPKALANLLAKQFADTSFQKKKSRKRKDTNNHQQG